MYTLQDDPRLFDYNVDERVEDFIKAVKDQVCRQECQLFLTIPLLFNLWGSLV